MDLLDRFTALLDQEKVQYCVIGGQAVNAYVDPLVSLDLDVAVAAQDQERIAALLAQSFRVEVFPHSLNVSLAGSDLRIQVQLDPRYAEFVPHATIRDVLGVPLRVARVQDVLRGKVWAASDATRRASKRQKDLADISRLIEQYPELRSDVPAELLRRLV